MGALGSEAPIEIWGGIECTFNRVGDRYYDQVAWSGHEERLDDLDRIADLGIRTLRVPVLWERIAPEGLDTADWRWADQFLARMRDLGMRPIATLVHHGSGPRSTHLLDDGFAAGLATFAAAVATRYPWIERFTPVNEPFTTARFSALYGHWYPHLRDMRACMRALLNESRATMLAMRSIRERTPHALLVQTEDIGKVQSTPHLRYQAEFENERRWLSLDLLCGRVDERHPLWDFLRWCGIEEREIAAFTERPCPPDVLGINYYVTSERFLDERLHLYPASTHGGNERDAYADVEVARVSGSGIAGLEVIARETADRYTVPIAVTEVHLGGPRCEQLRWFAEAWKAAQSVRRDGIDLRAITAWALFGSHNWDRLVTCDEGHYEPGAFDIRQGAPRPTGLATMIRTLAAGESFDHPALSSPGWWRRPERILYRASDSEDEPVPSLDAGGVVVVAQHVHLGEPLLRTLQARRLRAEIAMPVAQNWNESVDVRNAWAVVLIAPRVTSQHRRMVNGLLDQRVGPFVTIITSERDLGLSERALIIELPQTDSNHARPNGGFPVELSAGLWDDVIDLLIDGEPGRWSVTHDDVLCRSDGSPNDIGIHSTGIPAQPGANASSG